MSRFDRLPSAQTLTRHHPRPRRGRTRSTAAIAAFRAQASQCEHSRGGQSGASRLPSL